MKKLLAALGILMLLAIPARPNVPCTVPFNLTNGTTADASQVMANYNAILACLGNAAAAGINSDITQLLGLTSPFTPTQGGTPVFIGGTSTGSGNAQVVSATLPNNFTLTQNYEVIFKAGFTNSGATTLQVASTAATNLFKQSATGPVALTGNEIQAGQIVFAFYDGTQWEMLPPLNLTAGFGTVITGGNTVSISSTAPPYGFDQPVNLGLTAVQNTPSANLLQVCVTTAAGATPTATNPVLIPFTTNGLVTWLPITSAHCMNTNGAGASLGTQNSVPFRFWIVEFNNAGTPVLALWHSGAGAATTAIKPLDETSPQTTTAISNAATSAGVFYTPNGTTIGGGGANFKILGYLEYSSGLAAAGSYGSAPTKIQLFGPGVRKPGDQIQIVNGTTAVITPTSAINLILASGQTNVTNNSAAQSAKLVRTGAVTVGTTLSASGQLNAGTSNASFTWASVLDNPQTASSVTYSISAVSGSVANQSVTVIEVQG